MARQMKDSGIEWIGEIPENWKVTKLKHFISGYKAGPFGSALITDKLNPKGNFLVYTPEHIAKSTADLDGNLYLPDERLEEMRQFLVTTGDVIFPIVGSLGRSMLITEDMPAGIINQRLAKFRIDSQQLSMEYFLWLFSKSTFFNTYIDLNCRGAIIVNLTKQIVCDISIPHPENLKEQHRIAAFLDRKCAEIDAVIERTKATIEEYKKLKQAVITEAVTKGVRGPRPMKDSGIGWAKKIPVEWNSINPKALFTQRKDKARAGQRQLTASQQHGVIYQDEYMELTGSKVVTVEKDFDILKQVEAGDFVISMRSFQGGLEYSHLTGSISSAYVMLIPNLQLVYPRFFRWLLKSPVYINALQSTSNMVRDGQAMRYSNFAQVRLYTVPLEEQEEIADYLDEKCAAMDTLIAKKTALLTELETYKKSLIYEYVTGKKECLA